VKEITKQVRSDKRHLTPEATRKLLELEPEVFSVLSQKQTSDFDKNALLYSIYFDSSTMRLANGRVYNQLLCYLRDKLV
jgi:hypothetical protein